MKRTLASAAMLAAALLISAPASAEDKFGYTHDRIAEIKYDKDAILVHFEKYKKKGEYGCKDPYYKVLKENFGSTFDEVAAVLTKAAMYGEKIGLLVVGCEGEDHDGGSIVTQIKVDFAGYGDYGDRRGSYR